MEIRKLIEFIFSLPKTIYFNFKYLKFMEAIKLPIIVSHRVWIRNAKGNIKIQSPIHLGMIKIGFGDVAIFDKIKSRSIWDVTGMVIFKGRANIGHGSKINVAGTLILGNKFSISAESSIICKEKINFGDNCLLSWQNLVMDTDFHDILDIEGNIINKPKKILVGNNVWIGCRCTILKGALIGDNNVIASNTCIYKKIDGCDQIVGGNDNKILKKNISWRP